MSKPVNPQWLVNKFPNDLKAQVRYLVSNGYHVVSQDDKTAQLIKPKKFSCLFCLVTGFLPYLIWYLAKRDGTIYLDSSVQSPVSSSGQHGLKTSIGEWYDQAGAFGIIMAIIGGFIGIVLIGTIISAMSRTGQSSSSTSTATSVSTTDAR